MMLKLTDIERAINNCRAKHPPANEHDVTLPKDVRIMADAYGLMIFKHLPEIDLSEQSQELQQTVQRWLNPVPDAQTS